MLIVSGVVIAVLGLVWLLTPSIPWLGKLAGDIVVERENFKFYFPLKTPLVRTLSPSYLPDFFVRLPIVVFAAFFFTVFFDATVLLVEDLAKCWLTLAAI